MFLLIACNAHAKFYIFNADNRAVSITKYEPDREDLVKRNETAIRVDDDVDIALDEAEYVNGQVRKRAKSQEEENREKIAQETAAEYKLVSDRVLKNTIAELEGEGVVFKHIKEK